MNQDHRVVLAANTGGVQSTVNKLRKRGDPVELDVSPGAVLVNHAVIILEHEDCVLIEVDLRSKYARFLAIGSGADCYPEVLLDASQYTQYINENVSKATSIGFPEYSGWGVFSVSGPSRRYTLKVTLLKPDKG